MRFLFLNHINGGKKKLCVLITKSNNVEILLFVEKFKSFALSTTKFFLTVLALMIVFSWNICEANFVPIMFDEEKSDSAEHVQVFQRNIHSLIRNGYPLR